MIVHACTCGWLDPIGSYTRTRYSIQLPPKFGRFNHDVAQHAPIAATSSMIDISVYFQLRMQQHALIIMVITNEQFEVKSFLNCFGTMIATSEVQTSFHGRRHPRACRCKTIDAITTSAGASIGDCSCSSEQCMFVNKKCCQPTFIIVLDDPHTCPASHSQIAVCKPLSARPAHVCHPTPATPAAQH